MGARASPAAFGGAHAAARWCAVSSYIGWQVARERFRDAQGSQQLDVARGAVLARLESEVLDAFDVMGPRRRALRSGRDGPPTREWDAKKVTVTTSNTSGTSAHSRA